MDFGVVLETYVSLCMTELDFPIKCLVGEKWQNGAKKQFFKVFQKFYHYFKARNFRGMKISWFRG